MCHTGFHGFRAQFRHGFLVQFLVDVSLSSNLDNAELISEDLMQKCKNDDKPKNAVNILRGQLEDGLVPVAREDDDETENAKLISKDLKQTA